MLPIPDGAFVTGEYIEDWTWIRNRQAYILLTLNDGIVFKVVENRVEEERKLILHSLNPAYEPYELHINEIKEVWKFVNFISNEMPGKNYQQGEVSDQISDLRHEIDNIKLELKKRKTENDHDFKEKYFIEPGHCHRLFFSCLQLVLFPDASGN
jgi:hypothetical protein